MKIKQNFKEEHININIKLKNFYAFNVILSSHIEKNINKYTFENTRAHKLITSDVRTLTSANAGNKTSGKIGNRRNE